VVRCVDNVHSVNSYKTIKEAKLAEFIVVYGCDLKAQALPTT